MTAATLDGPRPSPLLGGDGLRGLAALLVFTFHMALAAVSVSHTGGTVAAFGPVGAVFRHLDIGLYLFFALSGYLVGRPFVGAVIDGRALPSLRRYARRRVLRIVPALWALTTLLLLRHVLLPDAFPPRTFLVHADHVPAIYLFLQTYVRSPAATVLMGPAWSLHPEVGFYILLPLGALALARLAGDRRRRITALLVVGAAVFAGSLLLRALAPDTFEWRRSIPEMLFAFVPGLLLAGLEPYAAPRLARLGHRRPGLPVALVGVAVLLLLLNAATPNRDPLLPDGDWWRATSWALAAGAMLAGVLAVQWQTGGCWRVLAAGPLRWVGLRSYSFYLVHQAIALEVAAVISGWRPWPAMAALVAFTLPVSLLVAQVSYVCFERPLMRRRDSSRQALGVAPA